MYGKFRAHPLGKALNYQFQGVNGRWRLSIV